MLVKCSGQKLQKIYKAALVHLNHTLTIRFGRESLLRLPAPEITDQESDLSLDTTQNPPTQQEHHVIPVLIEDVPIPLLLRP